jgi:VCBS repeat-containing protein
MRSKIRALALGVLAAALLIGCGQSTDQIGETVKTSMQYKFDSDSQFKQWHLSVTSVQVLKQGENRYRGIATVMHDGESHDVPVEITADGSNVMWQTPPGSFMFVALKEFQKLAK